jgi:hypothetical protein
LGIRFLERDGWLCAGEPIEEREELLAEHLDGSRVSLVFNECFEKDGALSDEQMAQFNAMAQRYATPRMIRQSTDVRFRG